MTCSVTNMPRPPEETERCVSQALDAGYRHVRAPFWCHFVANAIALTPIPQIDSAAGYFNEGPCGAAIKKSKVPRSDIFFTSKVPPKHMSYEAAKKQVADSLAASGLGYIDLMLIHAPYGGSAKRKDVWKALVEAVEEGKVHSIGVSNYGVHHLDELEKHISELEAERGGKGKGGVLSVGQWEIHPWCARRDIASWCNARGVAVEAYSPLVQGTRFGKEKVLSKLAQKHGVSEGQVLIRWSLQRGHIPLPKSVTPQRIKDNANIYGFELMDDDMAALETDEYAPICWDPNVLPLDK